MENETYIHCPESVISDQIHFHADTIVGEKDNFDQAIRLGGG
jgi:hypothetical protein